MENYNYNPDFVWYNKISKFASLYVDWETKQLPMYYMKLEWIYIFDTYYEWVNRTKFLLAVICMYSSLDDIQTDIIIKLFKQIFMDILGLAELFKTMNRPGPT